MLSQKGLCWLILVTIIFLSACRPEISPPPPNLPPQLVTIEPQKPKTEEYIIFVVDSVTPLRSGEDGPNKLVEFRLLVAATDEEGNYAGMAYCPGDEVVARNVGEEIVSPCGIQIAFSEDDVSDEIYIYVLGVDEDEVSLLGDIGVQIGGAVIAKGILEAMGVLAKGASLSNGAAFLLETAIGIVGSVAVDYFEANDLVGHHLFSLSKRNDWGAGQNISFVTNDGGMRVGYHVSRVRNIADVPVVVITDVPDTPAPTQPPATPALPPTSTPSAIAQPIDRLVLFVPGGRDVMTLSDGVTIDLGRIGTNFLDVRVDTDGTAGSVLFVLDGNNLNLNGRNVENVPPYIIGGDQNGEAYGNWNWSPLAGSTHTLRVWACPRAGGEGECAPPVEVSFYVQR